MANTIYIAYTDGTKSAIGSWYASPQNSLPGGAPANYGETTTVDPLWHTYFNGQSATIQQWLPAPTSN